MSYDEWVEKFHNERVIDLKSELNEKDIDILNQLNISVKDELYTGSEFEQLMIDLGAYHKDDEMSEIELQYCKSLEETNVSQEEYYLIDYKISNVLEKYKHVFSM